MDGINRIQRSAELDRWSSLIAQGTQPDSKQGGGLLLRRQFSQRNQVPAEDRQEDRESVYHARMDSRAIEYRRKMQDINSEIEALSLLDKYLESPVEEGAVRDARALLSQSAGPCVVELLNRLLAVSDDRLPDSEEIGDLRQMSATARKQLEDYLAANQSFCEETGSSLCDRILSDQSAAVSSQSDLKSNRVLQLLVTPA